LNWQHLRAFLWLRWRLSANQWRRGGPINAALMTLIVVGALAMTIPMFIGSLVLGMHIFPQAAPLHLMYGCDGLALAFVFVWMIGLITELQRTEPLSLSKFMHLPVSVNGAFLINYVASLLRVSLIVFVPMICGFAVALMASRGPALLPVLPLAAAFLLMITALSYQFQGWLASLMSNPRRRRTVIMVTTMGFVLIAQLPNLINLASPWGVRQFADQAAKQASEQAAERDAHSKELNRALAAGEIDPQEASRRAQELLERQQAPHRLGERAMLDQWAGTALLLNQVLPIGWLPLGVMSAAEGRTLPWLLGLIGMTGIGSVSLWRAYRTTLGLYQGQFTARQGKPPPVAASPAKVKDGKPATMLVERRLPGLSEPVSAIALGGLRSLLRSPEAKMMFMTPVIMGVIFGSLLLKLPNQIPGSVRPAFGIAAIVFVLFGSLQIMANQFGFDRDGFRVFVLCAAPRRDILLGKNLAFAPLTLGMVLFLLIIVQVMCPMRWDHFLAMFPQFVSMYLSCCVLMNLLSIYTPMPIAAGSMKPAHPKLVPILVQMLAIMLLFPLTQAPTFLPLGIEAGLVHLGWSQQLPIFLVLSVVECALVVAVYLVLLNWEGGLLAAREKKILECVTNRVP